LIKGKTIANLDNLLSPDVLADDIIENLQSALGNSITTVKIEKERIAPLCVMPGIEPDITQ